MAVAARRKLDSRFAVLDVLRSDSSPGRQSGGDGEAGRVGRADGEAAAAGRYSFGDPGEPEPAAGSRLDRYGAQFGLPQVYSGANNFWLWVPPPAGDVSAIAINVSRALLQREFRRVRRVATFWNGLGVSDDEQGAEVFVATGLRTSWGAGLAGISELLLSRLRSSGQPGGDESQVAGRCVPAT